MSKIIFTFPFLLLLAQTLHAQVPSASPDVALDSSSATVRAYIRAYNAHDIPALLSFLDSDFVWLNVAGDSVAVEVRGKEAVESGLHDYFRALPTARSEAETMSALGPWVTIRERAHWQGKNGPRSQAAISVYEVREGLIRRVWYYPVAQ